MVHAQFTAGNLVVEQVQGTSTNATQIKLLEYQISGTAGTTVTLPTSTMGAVNLITESGNATSDGQINLSANGSCITIPGYNAATGTSSVSSASINRVIARVDASATIGTTVILGTTAGSSTNAYVGNNFRSAVSSDGTRYWLGGAANNSDDGTDGVRTVAYGGSSATAVSSTQVYSPTSAKNSTNIIAVKIFNGQLYYSTQKGTPGVYTVTGGSPSGLPTSGATSPPPATFAMQSANSAPYSFVILPAGGSNLVAYVTDDGSGSSGKAGIYKYYYNGTSWASEKSNTSETVYGLTGVVSGTTVYLYATDGTHIYSLTDAAGFNANIPSTNLSTVVTTSSSDVLLGISFTPTAFSAQPSNATVCTGAAASFAVVLNAIASSSSGSYAYQWQLSTNSGSSWNNISNAGVYSNATSATLNISNSAGLTGNQYRCVATYMSSCILTSAAATLTVTPTIGTPTAITISSGTEPSCQLTNGTTTTTYSTTVTNSTSFNWSLNNAAAGSISSSGVMTWANGFSGNVNIQVTANGCNGPSSQIIRTVTVKGNPTANAGSNASICFSASYMTNGASVTNQGSLSWGSNGTGTFNNNALLNSTYMPGPADISNGSVTLTLTNTSTCGSASGNFILTINPDMWIHVINSDWNTAANWSCGIPTNPVNVLIPNNATPYPTLSGNVSIHNLDLEGTSRVIINNNTLTINGSISGSGTLTGSSLSSLVIGGTAGTLYFTGAPDTLLNLTLGTNGTATLGSALAIAAGSNAAPGTLSVGSGATLTTGNLLTLTSNDNSTAIVGPIPENGSGVALGAINGNVTVDRDVHSNVNIPNSAENGQYNVITNNGLRAWRFLTAPIASSGSESIQAAWQNNGIKYNPGDSSTIGIGTLITAPTMGSGIDTISGSSLYYWNITSQALLPMSSTTGAISNGNYGGSNGGNTSYMLFVRGDRNPATVYNPNFGGVPIDNTMLNPTGTLLTGRQVYAIKGETSSGTRSYTAIGNPYASPVDMSQLALSTNVLPTYYIWNPNLNSIGGYVTVDFSFGVNISVPNAGTSQYLQSGQSFLAVTDTTADGTLTFDESDKTDSNNNYVFRPASPASGVTQSFRSNLYLLNADSSIILADGNLAQFDNSFSNTVNSLDALKLGNINETFALVLDGTHLAIERTPIIVNTDTLFFSLARTTQRSYQFQFGATALNHPGLVGYLMDSYTGDSTALNLNGNTIVNFTVDANTGSQNTNRFMVVFEQGNGALPVTFTGVKAWQQSTNSNSISVAWSVENEINIKSYVIEKSVDGKTFSAVGTVAASGVGEYSWLDENGATGENYYRIQSIGNNGSIQYSEVVNVSLGAGSPAIAVYPNPVTDGLVNLQFTNMPAGKYVINLQTTLGQLLSTKTITHAGGSASESIRFNKSIAKETYELEIINTDSSKTIIYKIQ